MKKVWIGVSWKILSCSCFAIVNGLVRFLSSDVISESTSPTYVIMLYQNLIATCILLPFVMSGPKSSIKDLIHSKNQNLHFARVATAVCGIGLWYLSLRYMPMTQVIAISFIAPIITIIGSTVILSEKLTWPKTLAISLSLVGGFLISRPDKGIANLDVSWVIILPIVAASIFAFDKVLTKKLIEKGEKPNILTIYLVGFTALSCIVPFIYHGCPWPSSQNLPWLILLGIMGCAAHFSFSKAYEYAEVTFLMPFGISKFVLSAIVGYLAFNEIPRTFSMWVGMAVILLSTLLLNHPKASKESKQNFNELANQPTR